MTLAEALFRAYGLLYTTVYRIDEGKPVPVVAAAGSPEMIHVPSGIRREGIDLHDGLSEAELSRSPRPGMVEFSFGDEPWWTNERRLRRLRKVPGAGQFREPSGCWAAPARRTRRTSWPPPVPTEVREPVSRR